MATSDFISSLGAAVGKATPLEFQDRGPAGSSSPNRPGSAPWANTSIKGRNHSETRGLPVMIHLNHLGACAQKVRE